MKKFVLALCLLIISNMFYAKDRTIKVSNLPASITTFVNKNFPSAKITNATQESDDHDYNLILTDGTKLEFTQNGECTEIINKNSFSANILPNEITVYVNNNYPGKKIISIEHCKSGYNIMLDNKKKFQLDNKFKLTSFKKGNN